MMRKHPFIFILSLSLLLFLTVSCNPDEDNDKVTPEKLPAPELSLISKDAASFTIGWNAVEGASSYNYTCDWESGLNTTSETTLVFEGLETDSTYTVSVWAVPEDRELFAESDMASIEVTLELIVEDGEMFSIDMIDDQDRMTLYVTITPVDPEMMFYRETLDDYYFEEFGGNVEDAWANALQSYVDMFGSSVLQMVAERGTVDYRVAYVYDQHTYIMVAGIDSSLNRITSIVDTVYYSGPIPSSDITFDVDVRDITTSSAVVYVTPSNNDPWSMLLLESNALEDYTESDIESLVGVSYRDYINDGHVYVGEMPMTYREGSLDPDTEYTVLVFGWNTGLSTDVFRYTFTTEGASSSQDLTFTWDIEVLGPMEIHAVITPSDMTAQYLVVPMPDYDYEYYGTDFDAYIEYVTWGMITPYEYAYMFATTGVTDRIFNEFDDGIYPGSSYMFMAVGLDMDNAEETVEFYDPQTYGQMVTTPTE